MADSSTARTADSPPHLRAAAARLLMAHHLTIHHVSRMPAR